MQTCPRTQKNIISLDNLWPLMNEIIEVFIHVGYFCLKKKFFYNYFLQGINYFSKLVLLESSGHWIDSGISYLVLRLDLIFDCKDLSLTFQNKATHLTPW